MTAPAPPRDVPADGPATEAGWALLESEIEWDAGGPTPSFVNAVIAVEQQARQAALDDVRREVWREPEHFVSERFGWDFWAASCRGCGGQKPSPEMPDGWARRGHRDDCWVSVILDRLSGSRP